MAMKVNEPTRSAVRLTTHQPPAKPMEERDEAPAPHGWAPKVGAAHGSRAGAYAITTQPGAKDWAFAGLVQDFQAKVPARVQRDVAGASEAQLRRGVSHSWTQDVVQTPGAKPEKMTVELTKKLIPVPYDAFIAKVPPDKWGGPNLARFLGGEVRVVERDAQGRPTKQVERMVLAQDDLAPLLGPHAQRLAGAFANDMTKAETITYEKDRARVDWRVYGSDNGSTLADVGSVTFERAPGGTMVTFHSAHKLGVPGMGLVGLEPLPLPAGLIGKPLEGAFLAHANRYEALVK